MKKFFYILFISLLCCFSWSTSGQSVDDLTEQFNNENATLTPVTPVNQGAFKDDFREKYKDEAFNYKTEEELKISTPTFGGGAIAGLISNLILYILLPAIVLIVLVLLIRQLVNQRRSKNKSHLHRKKKDSLISTDEEIEDIHEIDFKAQIKTALSNQAYTEAIRWSYLQNLKLMDEKNIIDWQPKKTNQDYYYELKQKHLKKEFKYLTYVYNSLWFGQYTINQEDAFQILDKFKSFQLILNKK